MNNNNYYITEKGYKNRKGIQEAEMQFVFTEEGIRETD